MLLVTSVQAGGGVGSQGGVEANATHRSMLRSAYTRVLCKVSVRIQYPVHFLSLEVRLHLPTSINKHSLQRHGLAGTLERLPGCVLTEKERNVGPKKYLCEGVRTGRGSNWVRCRTDLGSDRSRLAQIRFVLQNTTFTSLLTLL